jgi:very-short-patch-repair endonuclease
MRSNSAAHNRAKSLRRALTPPEVMLWVRLRSRQPGAPRIRRQHPIGPYIADFYCAEAKLVIEIDGWGHNMGGQPLHDARRDAWLAEQGVCVLRYTADDVFRDPTAIADGVWDTCVERINAQRPQNAPSVSSPGGAEPPPPQAGQEGSVVLLTRKTGEVARGEAA